MKISLESEGATHTICDSFDLLHEVLGLFFDVFVHLLFQEGGCDPVLELFQGLLMVADFVLVEAHQPEPGLLYFEVVEVHAEAHGVTVYFFHFGAIESGFRGSLDSFVFLFLLFLVLFHFFHDVESGLVCEVVVCLIAEDAVGVAVQGGSRDDWGMAVRQERKQFGDSSS